jgi:hypothetical protein
MEDMQMLVKVIYTYSAANGGNTKEYTGWKLETAAAREALAYIENHSAFTDQPGDVKTADWHRNPIDSVYMAGTLTLIYAEAPAPIAALDAYGIQQVQGQTWLYRDGKLDGVYSSPVKAIADALIGEYFYISDERAAEVAAEIVAGANGAEIAAELVRTNASIRAEKDAAFDAELAVIDAAQPTAPTDQDDQIYHLIGDNMEIRESRRMMQWQAEALNGSLSASKEWRWVGANEYRTVTIPTVNELGNATFGKSTIAMRWVCPTCGAPRGAIERYNHIIHGYDTNGHFSIIVDHWKNPCGHVDYYPACHKEGAAGTTATADQPTSR